MKQKNKRHIAILGLIEKENIDTQDDLTKKLENMGIRATQATISRDIKELHLVKVMHENNKYCYEQRGVTGSSNTIMPSKSINIIRESIIHINFAQNLVIIKCYAGMAQAACAALDAASHPEIIGTLAGDDTIFLATESKEQAQTLMLGLSSMLTDK